MSGIEGFHTENENSEEFLSDIREISPEVADVMIFKMKKIQIMPFRKIKIMKRSQEIVLLKV